jgi:hypothetical protein
VRTRKRPTALREVKEGKVAPGVAAIITQLANTIIRAIEQDRKVRELDEVEERLAELERRAAQTLRSKAEEVQELAERHP